MFPRRNWLNLDSPNPSLANECAPPRNQRSGEGHTRLRVRGWESPNSDDWRKSLALCLPILCAVAVSGWEILGIYLSTTSRALHVCIITAGILKESVRPDHRSVWGGTIAKGGLGHQKLYVLQILILIFWNFIKQFKLASRLKQKMLCNYSTPPPTSKHPCIPTLWRGRGNPASQPPPPEYLLTQHTYKETSAPL